MKFENIDKKPDKINGIHLFSKPLKTCPVEYFKIHNNFSELKNESDKRAARINLGILWEAIEGDILENDDLQNALSIYLRKVEAAILNEEDIPTSNRESITYKKTDSNFLTNSNVYKTFSLIDKNILSNGQVAWFRMAYCPPNSSSNLNGSISFLYCLNNSLTEPSETDWKNIQNLNNIDSSKLLYKTNIVNNVTTSTNGYVLDARIGKSLNDKITSLNSTLDSKINDVNSTLGKKINDNTQEILYTQELIDRVEESINQRITNLGSVYSVQGSVSDLNALLKLSSAKKGYTYNIESKFYLNGKYYEAGTNVVCIKDFSSASDNKASCWDPLGGTFNASLYLEKDKAAIANKSDITSGIDRKEDITYTERGKQYISGSALGSVLPFKLISKTTLDNGDIAWYRLAFNYPTGSSNGAQQLLLQYAVTSNQSEPSAWTTIDYVNDINLKDIGSLKQSVNNLTKNLQLNYYSQDDINTIVQELSDAISDLLSELDDAKDVVVYQMPIDFISLYGETVEKEITTDIFQSIFGNIDEFINNVKTKHIRLGIPHLSDDEFPGFVYTDVTSSISVKISPMEEEVIDVINIQGSFSSREYYTISVEMIILCNSTDMMGSWTAKKETTPAELEEKINNILVDFGTVGIGNVYRTIWQWGQTHHAGNHMKPLTLRIESQFRGNPSHLETFVGTAQWIYGEGRKGAYHLIGSLSGDSEDGSKLVEILVYQSGIVECKNVSTSIIYNWDDFDFSVKKGIVSQEVYDNLLKADIITTHGVVFNAKMVEGNSIILVFYNYNYDFIEENKLLYEANIITVNKNLNYTAESFNYDLPNTDFVFQELVKKQDVLNVYNIFNSYSWEDKGTLTPQTLLDLFLNAEVGYYQFRIDDRTYRMIKHHTAQVSGNNRYVALDITGSPTWGYIHTDGLLGHWGFSSSTEPKIEDLISYQQIILSKVSDIVTYEIPSRWTEVGKQYQITQDNFHDIFGSEDELLKNLENKHVRLKIPGTEELGMLVIDVTTSLQLKASDETSVSYIINFNGNASHDPQDSFLIFHALDVRCGIGIEKNTDGTYSFIDGSFEIIKKENSVTTEEIADEAVTTEKIADGAITKDKMSDGLLRSLGSIIDKGTLDNQGMVALCESDEIGIFTCVDSRNRYTIIKPYKPTGTYQFLCIIDYPDGTNDLCKFGGDNNGHGGTESFVDTTVTQNSIKPISSGAVYNAIYSVLNTEV